MYFLFPLMFRKSVVKHLLWENIVWNSDKYVNTGKSVHLLKLRVLSEDVKIWHYSYCSLLLGVCKYSMWRSTWCKNYLRGSRGSYTCIVKFPRNARKICTSWSLFTTVHTRKKPNLILSTLRLICEGNERYS